MGETGWDMRGKPTTLVVEGFLILLTSQLDHKIYINSTFRGPASNARISSNQTKEEVAGNGGLREYKEPYKKARLREWNKCVESTDGTAQKVWDCMYAKRLAFYKTPAGQKNHGSGAAVDLNTGSYMTRGQVKVVLCVCESMGLSAIQEFNRPHIHCGLSSGVIKVVDDANKPSIVEPLLHKWAKNLKDSGATVSSETSEKLAKLIAMAKDGSWTPTPT